MMLKNVILACSRDE